MVAFREVSLSLLEDYSQSTRVMNISVIYFHIRIVGKQEIWYLFRSNSALTASALGLHSERLIAQFSSLLRNRLYKDLT
jgi:hypothetical protein